MIRVVCRHYGATQATVRKLLSKSPMDGLLENSTKSVGIGPLQIPVATMRVVYGGKYPYAEPWPYETKPFKLLTQFNDNTSDRLCENSKIITVEGNIGVGKLDFAERLAKEFDMKLFPSTPESKVFFEPALNLDLRIFDSLLSEEAQHYDLKKFFSDPNPTNGVAGRLQMSFYEARFFHYLEALGHLLSTGKNSHTIH